MKDQAAEPSTDHELTRFQRLARALFGVQKQDVPKHEPKKRRPATAQHPRTKP